MKEKGETHRTDLGSQRAFAFEQSRMLVNRYVRERAITGSSFAARRAGK